MKKSQITNQRSENRKLRFIKAIVFCSLLSALCSASLWALRIVSVVPSNTEIAEALGAGDEIVGVTIYDAMKPGRAAIGDSLNPSMETIVSLKPDIVLGGNWQNIKTVPELRRLGFRVVEVENPKSLEELYTGIRQIAQAIGRDAEAERVMADMRRRLLAVKRRASRLKHRPRTFIEIDTEFWTVGGKDFVSDAVALAGGDTIFPDIRDAAGQVASETIITRQPDLIISMGAKKEAIAQRPGWSAIPAITHHRILDDLPLTLTRPSPRIVEAIELLSQRIEAMDRP